jgi:hypothetical protein
MALADANGLPVSPLRHFLYGIMQMSWQHLAKLLSKDEARRIAANIAKLPELGPHVSDVTASQIAFPFEGALVVSIIVLIAATAVRFRCA